MTVTYCFFDGPKLLEFLSKSCLLCVPCKAAANRGQSRRTDRYKYHRKAKGCLRNSSKVQTYPMKSLDMLLK